MNWLEYMKQAESTLRDFAAQPLPFFETSDVLENGKHAFQLWKTCKEVIEVFDSVELPVRGQDEELDATIDNFYREMLPGLMAEIGTALSLIQFFRGRDDASSGNLRDIGFNFLLLRQTESSLHSLREQIKRSREQHSVNASKPRKTTEEIEQAEQVFREHVLKYQSVHGVVDSISRRLGWDSKTISKYIGNKESRHAQASDILAGVAKKD